MLLILNFKENQSVLRNKINRLQKDIELGIQKYAILEDEKGDSYYAYEIDELGNHIFMDDANIPSLLSLPFLGCLKENDKIY